MPPKRKTKVPVVKSTSNKRAKSSPKIDESERCNDTELTANPESLPITTKVIIKGKVPVDPHCREKVDSAHVLQCKDVTYNFMLNQTYMQNNNNKFYLGQVLEEDSGTGFSVWFRWGRIGNQGQTSLQLFNNTTAAISAFKSKFYSKTKNRWEDKDNFSRVDGFYDLIEQDFGDVSDNDGADGISKETVASLLPNDVFTLITLISNVQAMEYQMREMNYDSRRAPLGKLTEAQIKAGYAALNEVSKCIGELEKLKVGRCSTRRRPKQQSNVPDERHIRQRLTQACNEFYTRIPHDFRMRVPPLIETNDALKTELDLLKALEDIKAAFGIIKKDKESSNIHPADRNYNNLKCDIEPLEVGSKMDTIIKDYVRMTHAPTHSSYGLEVLQIFELSKDGDTDSFRDYGNRRLLWHGSRLTNWMGILGRGLKIAPPEAPSTGYMFGKGVYFADCVSKSANYTYASSSNAVGILALCEVSLGECNELQCANYDADKLPTGKHSTMGVGRNTTDCSTWITLDDGVVVPCGNIIDSKVQDSSLYYNEFIVYDTHQIRLRYLVQLKFNYNY